MRRALPWLLTIAVIGSGCYRLGGFLLGAAPAVHPSIGAWLCWRTIVVSACVIWVTFSGVA